MREESWLTIQHISGKSGYGAVKGSLRPGLKFSLLRQGTQRLCNNRKQIHWNIDQARKTVQNRWKQLLRWFWQGCLWKSRTKTQSLVKRYSNYTSRWKNRRIEQDRPQTWRHNQVSLDPTACSTRKNKLCPGYSPDARNTVRPRCISPIQWTYYTIQYCEIENCSFELKPENIIQKAYWYYFEDANSTFRSSDTVLNKVWDICKYTIKATSFAGIYIDGDRERILMKLMLILISSAIITPIASIPLPGGQTNILLTTRPGDGMDPADSSDVLQW